MKKIIIVCGLIAGFISTAWMVSYIVMSRGNPDTHGGVWLGYASMLLAFSLIFVGVKKYRDQYNQGAITFGKAFRIGFFITLIASTIYVVAWLIDFYYFIPDFSGTYTRQVLDQMKAAGASQQEINKQALALENFNRMYQNPFFNALITYSEILPVGLAVSLISSAILRKSQPKHPDFHTGHSAIKGNQG